jgi:membrane protease YdiL (CAAX protease family)
VFLTPLLIAYEVGVTWLGGANTDALRNGADCWMRRWLLQTGLEHPLLLPGIVVFALLGWHVAGRYSSRVSADTLVGMFSESLLFAFLLVTVGRLQGTLFENLGSALTLSTRTQLSAAPVISYLGAGIYEEVLFRLCLLPACFGLFRMARLTNGWAAAFAVLSSSLIFSFAHYIGSDVYQFTLFSFTFRTLAGMFFAVLFVLRGFGITVGCHATYDVLVGALLSA